MPTVPQECQGIADEIAALETVDQNLRSQLANLVGADAWAALAQLGQTRDQLTRKRAELDVCVRAHSAALQANLVIIDLVSTASPTRVAHLWEITDSGSTQLETSTVSANAFSFMGPLPTQFGISVVTTGTADVVGPDFRSSPIDASSLTGQGPIRVEAVLGPEVRLEAAEVSQLVADGFTPVNQHITAGGGTVAADLSVLTVDAALGNGVVVSANGQITVQGPLGVTGRFALSGRATLNFVASGAPASADVLDIVSLSDVNLEVTGDGGQAISALLQGTRGFLAGLLADQIRQVMEKALPALVAKALVLPDLPPGVTLSVRRIQIDGTGITLQPALGAIGTTLSTFRPPIIPPP